MAVRIATTREYVWPVPWGSETDQGNMLATFYLPTKEEYDSVENDKTETLELVLKKVEGLEIEDASGNVIESWDDIKNIIISDEEINKAFFDAFMEMWIKKTQPAILQTQALAFMELLGTGKLKEIQQDSQKT